MQHLVKLFMKSSTLNHMFIHFASDVDQSAKARRCFIYRETGLSSVSYMYLFLSAVSLFLFAVETMENYY